MKCTRHMICWRTIVTSTKARSYFRETVLKINNLTRGSDKRPISPWTMTFHLDHSMLCWINFAYFQFQVVSGLYKKWSNSSTHWIHEEKQNFTKVEWCRFCQYHLMPQMQNIVNSNNDFFFFIQSIDSKINFWKFY